MYLNPANFAKRAASNALGFTKVAAKSLVTGADMIAHGTVTPLDYHISLIIDPFFTPLDI